MYTYNVHVHVFIYMYCLSLSLPIMVSSLPAILLSQVLIHINVNHAQGVGYEEEWATPLFDPPAPSPHPPDTETANGASQNHQEPPTTTAANAGDGITQTSRSVGFIDSPEVVDVAPLDVEADDVMPVEPSTSWGQSAVVHCLQ